MNVVYEHEIAAHFKSLIKGESINFVQVCSSYTQNRDFSDYFLGILDLGDFDSLPTLNIKDMDKGMIVKV